MLDHIKIEGYKSIEHLDLDLKPINILIGANGAGKTNFVSFFKLVNTIFEQRLQNFTMRTGADRLLFYGIKRTKQIKGSLTFSHVRHPFSSNTYSFSLELAKKGSMILAEEASWYNKDEFKKCNIEESFIKDSTSFERNKWLKNYLESYKIYHFHDTSATASLRSEANINDAFSLRTDGANLPAILYLLQKIAPKTLKEIELIVQSVMPGFERFFLEPNPHDKSKIGLSWREISDPEKYFDANDISDGSLRLIALATLMLQPELPGIIIIDEPELGLHPVAINKLADMIKSAATRGCQIIVATQSVDLINNFAPEDVVTVDRKDGQSVFDRPHSKDLKGWLEDYSLGELWKKGVINGRP